MCSFLGRMIDLVRVVRPFSLSMQRIDLDVRPELGAAVHQINPMRLA